MKQTLRSFMGHIMLLFVMLVPQMAWAMGGDGTINNPYTISSAEDLAEFRDIVNGGTKTDYIYAKLNADITLSGSWTPIGTEKHPFYGYFMGGWHSITGLNIEYTSSCQGLFGCTKGNDRYAARIQNFTLYGTMKSGTSKLSKIGTVVGYAKEYTKVIGVTSNVDISFQNGAVQSHVGGIVGYSDNNLVIAQCKYSGTLNLGKSKDCLGGICGYLYANYRGEIIDCIFCGSLKTASTDNSSTYVGGIMGYNRQDESGNLRIKRCLSAGTISTESGVTKYVGGIIGYPNGKAANDVSNCYVLNGLTIHGNSKTTGGSNCSLNDVKNGKITYWLEYYSRLADNWKDYGLWRQNIGSDDYPYLSKSTTEWGGYVFKVDAKYCTGEALDEYYSNYNGAVVFHKNYDTEFMVDQQPTCTEEGSKSKHCKNFANCGAKIEVTSIPALGHDYESDFAVDQEPSSTTDGSKSRHCIRYAECGAKTEETAIHVFEPFFTIDKESTSSKHGTMSKHCVHYAECGGRTQEFNIHHFAEDDTFHDECTICHHFFVRYEATSEVYPKKITFDLYYNSIKPVPGHKGHPYYTAVFYDPQTKGGYFELNTQCAIGFEGFSDAAQLTSIRLPKGINAISKRAFINCFNLSSLSIANPSVTIGDNAFMSTSLSDITLKAIPSFGTNVFYDTPANKTITLDLSDDSDINEGGNSIITKVTSASYSRSIKANWNTICLPFDAESTENTKFYVIGSLENGVITLKLAETLPAGTPALVYTTSNTKLDIKASNAAINTTVTNADGTNRLVGTFKSATVPGATDTNHLFYGLSANKGTYVKVSSDVALKPFRAYIECENTSSNEAGLRQFVAGEDIDATAISDVITTLSDSETEYFDMNGRKIAGLQKGMNIVKKDGKVTKVLIK